MTFDGRRWVPAPDYPLGGRLFESGTTGILRRLSLISVILITVMSLFALGLNHHTAPLQVRERVAFAPEGLYITGVDYPARFALTDSRRAVRVPFSS